jgi:murein DD-endopeptidase MepM/ murein hydrolase activator NlpD
MARPRHHSLLAGMTRRLKGHATRPTLSFEMKGYQFSVEKGLCLKSETQPAKRSLRSKIIITSLLTMLPSLWWLNSSNAFYEPVPEGSSLLQTQRKLYLPAIPPKEEHPFNTSFVPASSEVFALPWLHIKVGPNDSLESIFAKHQLNGIQLQQIMGVCAKALCQLYPAQTLHIKHDDLGRVKQLILELNTTEELYLYKKNNAWKSKIRPLSIQTKIISTHATITRSLTAAAEQAELSEHLLNQVIALFRWEFDVKTLRPGDQLSVIYEQHWFNQQKEEGAILAAEFIQQGKIYRAMRYTDKHHRTHYYTPQGESLHKVDLKVPVEFTRISSYFGDRKHPIFNKFHFHTGVDYAASHGTPVIAAGDAIVVFVGRKSGYGKTIILEHNQRCQTLYAHLSRYAKDLQPGQKVLQNQIIGYVGRTGRATGSHLHYEFQVDGIPQDPLQSKLPPLITLTLEEQNHFRKQTQAILSQLDTLSLAAQPIVQKKHRATQSILKQHTRVLPTALVDNR